jgi:hypothetical protein
MPGRRAALTAVLIVAFFAGPLAASQEGADMHMVDAGFIMRPADTAPKLERLKRLPPLKFVARTRNGTRYFLYADPDVCKCLFVGNAAALKAYRDMRALPAPAGSVPPRGVVPEAMMIDDINSDDDALFGGDDFFGVPFDG